MSNVLAIGAHPDDIEFGCSGALLKHKEKGDKTYYICLTNGLSENSVTHEIIRSENEYRQEIGEAVFHLHVDDDGSLDYRDLHLPFNKQSISDLEKYLKKWEIDTIYTHWIGDSNQDHQAAFKMTMAAGRYVKNIYCYEQIPILRNTENQIPINYYVDITNHMDGKIRVSKAHASQIKKYAAAGFDVIHNLYTMAAFRGIQAGCKYAEGFHIIKMVDNSCQII